MSPRVSLDVTRINLRGTEKSLTLHTTYGLLEQMATLSFQNPHFQGKTRHLGDGLWRLLECAEHHDVQGVDAAG